ncbi:TetR/AcrR family transcriptional regulator [Halosaccharopolyspora lacisalsi]|nr:TetR/AcrR family transcriptional regulator [Halosaccharopolyspora lacisalsi]
MNDSATRRRGHALQQAIHEAALAELVEVGYAHLTMEGVARRSRTGKAALYRRWASKHDLVLDAVKQALPEPRAVAPRGSARDELIAALTALSDVFAGRTPLPGLTVLGEVLREPTLREAFTDLVVAPRLHMIEAVLRAGAHRNGADPDTVTLLLARTGPALVVQSVLLTGEPPTAEELTRIVDELLLPLLAAPSR